MQRAFLLKLKGGHVISVILLLNKKNRVLDHVKVDISSRVLSSVQPVTRSVLLKQLNLRNQFYFITVKLAFPGHGL